jgi:intracellular septation protein
VYLGFAAVLGYGLAARRPLLAQLFGSVYPGLDGEGWRKLTRNWALFFVAMAAANEAVWRWTAPMPTSDLTTWAAYKLWVVTPLTLVFAAANLPMLMKHGLMLDGTPPEGEVPPQG